MRFFSAILLIIFRESCFGVSLGAGKNFPFVKPHVDESRLQTVIKFARNNIFAVACVPILGASKMDPTMSLLF
jgi:hypothetical protein